MLIRCLDNKLIRKVENYIGSSYYKCLYLYLDLEKYGYKNKDIKIWVQENEEKNITAIILMYYSGMHIFSKKYDYNMEEIKKLVLANKPSMICGEKKTISDLYKYLDREKYFIETGWVRKLSNVSKFDRSEIKTEIKKDDFTQIAKLLYEDEDIGSSYKLKELEEQMIERNKEKYSRNYIIKKDDKVVSHAGTGAENEKVAMLSYVITAPQYRGKGYAKKLCSAICEDLILEGKDVFLINYSTESTALYDKIGFKVCCDWGKIFLNLKK